MTNIFFDTEFTHLAGPVDDYEPQLISIGCISEDGRKFYAESADFDPLLCSDFTQEVVLPLLEGGDVSMSHTMLAKQLKSWIEGFEGEVKLWSDAPGFDWPLVIDLFQHTGWPANLRNRPAGLSFASAADTLKFERTVEMMFSGNTALRRHHALDDAMANRVAFMQVTSKKSAD